MQTLEDFLDGKLDVKPQTKKRYATAKTPEGRVKNRIKYELDRLGCWWFMTVTSGYSKSGVPDFIGCYKGKFFAIEAKSNMTTHPVTALQKQELLKITSSGGIPLVIDETNINEIEEFLNEVSK